MALLMAAFRAQTANAFGTTATQPADPPQGEPSSLVRAWLHLERPVYQVGQPMWANFCVSNLTADSITLQVPDTTLDRQAHPRMGLPQAHVFSGSGFTALHIRDAQGDAVDAQVAFRPSGPVPAVQVEPWGTIGIRLDLARYYPSLAQRPGKYTLTWRPYGGTVEAEPLIVNVLAEQQATLLTDFGKMTMRFYYDEAPRHVQNFLELAGQRFYDNLTFHRVVPGGIVQGGDPRGDGKGIRADFKRIPAEFSKIRFETGTVGMARSPKDPDSASCQFFICLSRQPSFDGQQTAFGHLVGDESFATLQKIAAVPTGPHDRPKNPIYIRAVSLENISLQQHEPPPGLPAAPAAGSTSRPVVLQGLTVQPPATPLQPDASSDALLSRPTREALARAIRESAASRPAR